MVNKDGVIINVDLNVKNWLIKVDVMMDLFGIPVYVNMNVISHKMLENIKIMQIANVENTN